MKLLCEYECIISCCALIGWLVLCHHVSLTLFDIRPESQRVSETSENHRGVLSKLGQQVCCLLSLDWETEEYISSFHLVSKPPRCLECTMAVKPPAAPLEESSGGRLSGWNVGVIILRHTDKPNQRLLVSDGFSSVKLSSQN